MPSSEILFFAGFIFFILTMLVIDLGVFSKTNHIVSFKEAAIWSGVWVSLAMGFYFVILYYGDWLHSVKDFSELKLLFTKYAAEGVVPIADNFEASLDIYRKNMAFEFLTGYFLEYSLSADNIFVIIMIFTSFGVKEKYYKKVLFWGILGALIMRFLFIFIGSAMIQQYGWVIYGFGIFLVYTGVKMFFDDGDDDVIEPEKHRIVKFMSKYFSVYPRYVRDNFFVKRKGKKFITPLFLVLVIIELTDLLFAVDSVPAVFAVTKDPYVVFFSNIFAIMGLRSMFFFLSNIMHLFHYLKIGLAILLTFIGLKMIFGHYLHEFGYKNEYSLFIILGILVVSIGASLAFPPKKEPEAVVPPENKS